MIFSQAFQSAVVQDRGRQRRLAPEAGRRAERAEINNPRTELLVRVGLTEHAKQVPAQLSRGQKQRVRHCPRAVDQPQGAASATKATSALDPQTTAR